MLAGHVFVALGPALEARALLVLAALNLWRICALVLDPKNLFKQEEEKKVWTILLSAWILSLKADLKKAHYYPLRIEQKKSNWYLDCSNFL